VRRRDPGAPGGPARLILLLAPVWVVLLRQALIAVWPGAGWAPDLLLAVAAAVAWTQPPTAAVAFAAAAGLLVDVPSGTPFGLAGARLGLLVLGLTGLRRAVALELPGARTLMVAGFAYAERVSAALTLKAFAPDVALEPLLARSWKVAVATAALAPLVWGLAGALRPEEPRRGGGRR